MAQYFYDIGAQPLDVAPSGWTVDGFSAAEFKVVADAGSLSGKAIFVSPSSDARRFARYDAPGQETISEILVRFKTVQLSNATEKAVFPAALMQNNPVASLQCYYAKTGTYPTEKRVYLGRYNTTVFNHTATLIPSLNVGSTTLWTWMRLRVDSDVLYLRMWNDGDDEPETWTATQADSTLSAAGYVGLFAYYLGNTMHVSHYSVGTGADSAPSESLSSVAFSGTPTTGDAPLSVTFTDESTGATSWSWTFGDGGTSTSQNPSHTYTVPGVYDVTLSINSGAESLTKTGYITVTNPNPPTIDGDFNGGNLNETTSTVVDTGDVTINIKARRQINDYKVGARWWYFAFKIDNASGLRPFFSLDWTAHVNESTDGAPSVGPRAGWKPCYSYTPNDPDSWVYASSRTFNTPYVTWQFPTAFTQDTVYVSYRPFCHQPIIDEWIAGLNAAGKIQNTPSSSGYSIGTLSATQDERGATIPALPIPAFKFGSGPNQVVLTSGVHPCEDHATQGLLAAVDWLTGTDADAVYLRSKFTFYIYPLINPQGRYGRNYRGTFDADGLTLDPNRDWTATPSLTCIQLVRAAIIADTGGFPEVFIDFHGHHQWTNPYAIYGSTRDATNLALATAFKNDVLAVFPSLFWTTLAGDYSATYIDTLGSPMASMTIEVNDDFADATVAAESYGVQLVKSIMSIEGFITQPVISATTSASSTSAVSATVTTDTAGGTIYGVLSESATEMEADAIKSGANDTATVTTAGDYTLDETGLATWTQYYWHIVHEDADGLMSNVLTLPVRTLDISIPLAFSDTAPATLLTMQVWSKVPKKDDVQGLY